MQNEEKKPAVETGNVNPVMCKIMMAAMTHFILIGMPVSSKGVADAIPH